MIRLEMLFLGIPGFSQHTLICFGFLQDHLHVRRDHTRPPTPNSLPHTKPKRRNGQVFVRNQTKQSGGRRYRKKRASFHR